MITFTQIKQWTILGILLFIFGGGLIFIPEFSLGAIGGQPHSDRSQQSFKNYSGLSLLTDEEKKKLYKYTVENQCHVKPFDLNKKFDDNMKEYQKKQGDVEKDALVERYNGLRKKMNPQYKKSGAKDDVAKKMPPDPSVDSKNKLKKQTKKQEKTPPENGEKSMCEARGENPTSASEEGSSCKLAQVQTNNFCAMQAYMNFSIYDGESNEKAICRDYPDKCSGTASNGKGKWDLITSVHASGKEYSGGAVWYGQYIEKRKAKIGRLARKMEMTLNESSRQFRHAAHEIAGALQDKSKRAAEKKKQYQRDAIMKAAAKRHEKEANCGPQGGHTNRKATQNSENNPDVHSVGGKSRRA